MAHYVEHVAVVFVIAKRHHLIGRNTQGIRLINLSKRDDEIADVCRVPADEDQAEQEDTSIGEREEDADPTTLDEPEETGDDTPESEED